MAVSVVSPAPVDAGQPGVLRADDAVQRHRGVPGFGRAEVVAHQAGDRGLRGLAAHATGAHAVGDGHDGTHAALALAGQHGGAEVLVDVLAASLRDEADVDVKSHAPPQARRVPRFGACAD
jgi:hypothetical protein